MTDSLLIGRLNALFASREGQAPDEFLIDLVLFRPTRHVQEQLSKEKDCLVAKSLSVEKSQISLGTLILGALFSVSVLFPQTPAEQSMKKLLCLIAILALVSPCSAKPIRIMVFGDSLSWGFIPNEGRASERYQVDSRWPGVIQKELGSDYEVIDEFVVVPLLNNVDRFG
jgi:hypothetical protein